MSGGGPGLASIGERIRDLRVRRGWSQAELARRAAVAPSYISLVEASHRVPKEDFLRALAPHLGANYDYLMTGRRHCDEFDVDLRLGEGLLRKGQVNEAAQRFQHVLDHAPELTCVPQRQQAQWGLAGVHERKGDFPRALEVLQALAQADDLTPSVSRTAVITEYCLVLRKTGRYEEAIEIGRPLLDQLKPLPPQAPEREGYAELASTLVGCYRDGGQVQEAQALALEAMESSRGSLSDRGAAYWAAAIHYAQEGDHETARLYLDRALTLYSEAANARAVASLQVNSAWLILQERKRTRADVKRAEGLLEEALETLRVAGASAEVASAEIELGRCYYELGKLEKAAEAAGRAEAVLPPDAVVEVARAKQLRADIQAKQGNLVDAGTAYRQIAEDLRRHGLNEEAKALMRELADTLRQRGQADHAVEVYRYLVDEAASGGRTPAKPR